MVQQGCVLVEERGMKNRMRDPTITSAFFNAISNNASMCQREHKFNRIAAITGTLQSRLLFDYPEGGNEITIKALRLQYIAALMS